MARGQTRIALQLVEDRLIEDPEDEDAWYLAAELLMKMGRGEEGFCAMARARELSRRR